MSSAAAGPRILRAASALVLFAIAACEGTADPIGPVPVASVGVTPSSQAIFVGTPVTLEARPLSASGEVLERTVTWSSENEALATVTSAGVVTPLSVGEVGIRASAGGRTGRALLTISPIPVAEVRLSADEEVVLPWNGATQLAALALDANGNVLPGRIATWQSNRPNIVTVNEGRVTAVKPGLATITAMIEGKVSSVGVRITEVPVASLRIVGPTTALEVTDGIGFAAERTLADGGVFYGPATWTTSNPNVIKVESSDISGATLVGVAPGEATITISVDGIQASATLKVYPRPTHDLIYNRWTDTLTRIMQLSLQADGMVPEVLNAGAVSRDPSPSPDGTRFVFAVSQMSLLGEWQNDLYIVDRNGMNMRRLTDMPDYEDAPQWSPDGTKILFRAIVNNVSNLYTINVDGTGLVNLTAGMPATIGNRREPAWSPDGQKVVFIAAKEGQHKVWTIRTDGTQLTQVTTDGGFDLSPTFSPDGQKIAFTRHNAANVQLGDDIMVVPAQGGTPTRFALPGDQRTPAWSPDGSLIAVTGTATAGEARTHIYTMRADGTGLRLRTTNPAWYGAANPAWIAR